MSATFRAQPDFDDDGAPEPRLVLTSISTPSTCVLRVAGELDISNCDQLISASTLGRHPAMVIDLGGATFMDCGGYWSLVVARIKVEGQGRSLTVRGQTGQPARFLELIADLDIARHGVPVTVSPA